MPRHKNANPYFNIEQKGKKASEKEPFGKSKKKGEKEVHRVASGNEATKNIYNILISSKMDTRKKIFFVKMAPHLDDIKNC